MPANKYALLRYRIIDRVIRNHRTGYPSKEDLRQACEEALYGSSGERISMSTIDKDLWAMRNESELGYYAPIRFNKQYQGYEYTDENYSISDLPLNEDDLDVLKEATRTLFQFKDIPLFKQFDSAIEKIIDRMNVSMHDSGENDSGVIQFERSEHYSGSEYLEGLYRSTRESVEVQFEYRKFGADKPAKVRLRPLLLKEYKGRWYVIGVEVSSDKVKTYSLDRMSHMKELDAPFASTNSFDANSFFHHAMGITVTNEPPMKVRLRISDQLAPYIMSQPIHQTQRVVSEDNGLEIEIMVLHTYELVASILGYGDEVTVVSPLRVRNEVKERLIKCLEKYSD